MTRWTNFLCLALVASAAGCSVPLQDAALVVRNSCESDADCGAAASCVDNADGSRACVATEGDLSGLLLDVRPPVTSNGMVSGLVIGGGAYLIAASDLDGLRLAGTGLDGVNVRDVPLPIPIVSEVRVSAFAQGDSCAAEAGATIPAEVVFTRVSDQVGLPAGEFRGASAYRSADGVFAFQVAMPLGRYDIYVQPKVPENCLGEGGLPLQPPPPYLVRGFQLDPALPNINIALPERQRLTGSVDAQAALDIEGWTVGLLDRSTAQPISTEVSLKNVTFGIPAFFEVEFHPTKVYAVDGEVPEGPAFPYVRVRAPEEQGYTPSMVGRLEELDIDGNYDVALTLGQLSKPVEVSARVARKDSDVGIPATVSFTASFDNGMRFQRIVTTDDNGDFVTSLITKSAELPGQYQCFARPLDDTSPEAIGNADWQINPGQDFIGHVVELSPRPLLSGQVTVPSGVSVEADVVAAQSTRTSDPIAPRAVQSALGEDGALSINLDPGTFDLTVKPVASSGFPWLVTSQLDIADSPVELGQLQLPSPIVLKGKIVDAEGNPVPFTPMSAWLPVVDASGASSSVVQVGQTVSDGEGNYTLLLPPSLAH